MIQAVGALRTEGASGTTANRQSSQAAETSFAQWFQRELASTPQVKFSAHASQRLRERNITLTEADQSRLSEAVDQAEAKGARESLILMDSLALVVNVPNRTVITALSQDTTENTVFTNIDSAVVVAKSTGNDGQTKQSGLDPFWGSPYVAE